MDEIAITASPRKARKNYSRSQKMRLLVDALRIVAKDRDLTKEKIYMPDKCEKYGFAQGYHEVGTLFHFLADMIEE